MIPPAILLVLALLFCLQPALAYVRERKRRGGARDPPGPPGVPFFGNYFQIAKVYPWRQFKTLADQYGPIMRLRLGGKNLIVLSTGEVANEILDKQSAITASREPAYMAGELLSGNKRLLLVPYGDQWRKLRRALHAEVTPRAATSYEPIQTAESTVLLAGLLAEPNDFRRHIQRFTISVITTVAFGKRVVTGHEPAVKSLYDVMSELARVARPGAYLVDSIPALKHLPSWLAPWEREGRRLHELELGLFRSMFMRTKLEHAEGKARPCFVTGLVDKQAETGLADDDAAYLTGSLFGAGSDTTAMVLLSFILLILANPDAHDAAQEELDQVVGRDRLPTFEDCPSLPFVRGILKETLRLRPVTAGGFAHVSTEDIVYRDYFIPRGSSLLGNHWAIGRDPVRFPDPEAFRPERWAADKGSLEEGHLTFGFGRRICPGQHVAVRSMFIVMARLLWGFNVGYAKNAHGDPIPVDQEAYTNGFNSGPQPFCASITPRDEARAELVRREFENVQEVIRQYAAIEA